MTRITKVSKTAFLEAVRDSKGWIYEIQNKLGVSRKTVHNYMKRWPEGKEILEDIREARHDKVEGVLQELIAQGNVTAVIFYLKTQCKSRGFVERQEVTGGDGEDLNVTVKWSEPVIDD